MTALDLVAFAIAAAAANVAAALVIERVVKISFDQHLTRIKAVQLKAADELRAVAVSTLVPPLLTPPPAAPLKPKRGRPAKIAPATETGAGIPFDTDRDPGDEATGRTMLDMGKVEEGLEAAGRA